MNQEDPTQRLNRSLQRHAAAMDAVRKAMTDALVGLIVKVKAETGLDLTPQRAMEVHKALNARFGPHPNLADAGVQAYVRELL